MFSFCSSAFFILHSVYKPTPVKISKILILLMFQQEDVDKVFWKTKTYKTWIFGSDLRQNLKITILPKNSWGDHGNMGRMERRNNHEDGKENCFLYGWVQINNCKFKTKRLCILFLNYCKQFFGEELHWKQNFQSHW